MRAFHAAPLVQAIVAMTYREATWLYVLKRRMLRLWHLHQLHRL
jgi:hypothetical protein